MAATSDNKLPVATHTIYLRTDIVAAETGGREQELNEALPHILQRATQRTNDPTVNLTISLQECQGWGKIEIVCRASCEGWRRGTREGVDSGPASRAVIILVNCVKSCGVELFLPSNWSFQVW